MQCISCGKLMKPVNAGGIVVDVCTDGCGGMWFDMMELKRLDEPCEGAGEELLRLEPPHSVPARRDRDLECPKCGGTLMMRFFYNPERRVEVDRCPYCGGYWLDAGELRRIREEAASDGDRDAGIDTLLRQEFGADPEPAATGRPHALRRLFGFLVPTAAHR